EQPVREPRIARQQRPVQVRADGPPHPAALQAGLAVVPEAGDDATGRLGAGIEPRPARVVLEPGQRAPGPLAVEEDVADHAPVTGDGLVREEADAGQIVAGHPLVAAPEQLVAPADREQRRAALDRRVDGTRLAREIFRDDRLLAVLPAADVEEVVRPGLEGAAQADGLHLQPVPAPRRAPLEHGDVAAVGVDVQVVRIQVPDADPHAARSQYWATWPREAITRRSASIAV